MSLYSLQEFCHVWNLRVLYSGTSRKDAGIGIPWMSFKRMFHKNPVPQVLPVPAALSKFLASMEVKGISIIEVKPDAKKTA